MQRNELFQKAENELRGLHERYPDDPAINSILAQIAYLISLDSGKISDRSRLKDITIGILTAREIEPLDMRVADILHSVSAEAERM